jgi:Uma2 family endonuclease
MYQTDPPRPPKEILPTMYDLPSENVEDAGLPDEFHNFQPQLLRETFTSPEYPEDEVFIGSDLNLYYDIRHINWYKRPDWFAVLGVDRLYEKTDLRLSYVVWQEGVNPFIAVELLSPSTEKEDLGKTLRDAEKPPTKWKVYEQILRIPYYIIFDRYTDNLRVFKLSGGFYQEMELNTPRVWIDQIKLGLGIWEGSYQNIERKWLRWFDNLGNWILTPKEKQEQELEKQRLIIEKLASQLRALGIEPEL